MENMEFKIREKLHSIGISTSHLGYTYIIEALKILAENPTAIQAFGEKVYTAIAKKYVSTPSRVERAIRYAKESTDRMELKNKEFIAQLAEEIKFNQVF